MAAALSHLAPPARWPTGHFAWLFAGIAQFAGGASTFLAEGLARGERSMYVADDPRPDLWPGLLLARRSLVVASTSEIYGTDHRVVAGSQRDTFASTLEDALSDGYSGLRVAADNSALVRDPEQLTAWVEWEEMADDLMAENPLTGMCGFDCSTVKTGNVGFLVDLHPITVVQ